MRILLDTHIFFWLVTDRSRISPGLLDMLSDPENDVFFSAVVSWEIGTKRALSKLAFSGSPIAVALKHGLTELAINAEHCEAAAELEPHHKDPFDRLLIAQALVEGLVLATGDAAMARYGIRLLRNS